MPSSSGCKESRNRLLRAHSARNSLFLLIFLLVGCAGQEEPALPDEQPLPEVAQVTYTPGPTLASPLCPGPEPVIFSDRNLYQPPSLPEPLPRQPFREPIFGACMVRVTDRSSDLAPDDASAGLKNEYARVQSFNADGSRLLVRGLDGTWYLYDAQSLLPWAFLPLSVEPRWDASDPNIIYYIEDTGLFAYDIAAGQANRLRDFAADLPGHDPLMVWTRYEGSPSYDTRYWGLMAENEDWLPTAFLIYDRLEDQVTLRDLRGVAEVDEDVDNVAISPLGTYFLASFDRVCAPGELGSDAHPCGLMIYDRDLRNGRGLLRIVGHGDTALDAQGREVWVYQDIDTDHISMLDLESGAVTPLWPIDFSHTPIGLHFSGRASNLPGWVLVSTYSGGYPSAFTWMDNQVFAIELAAQGRVLRIAHTQSIVDENQEHDYWAEPQASVNPDFTRIVFTSNWGRSGSEAVEMYLVELPEDWVAFMQE